MLTIVIPGTEAYNHKTREFTYTEELVLDLEHSLVSLSDWEFKHEKPFLTRDKKTPEEILDYIRCMVLTPNVPPGTLDLLMQENLDAINDYLNAKATATWFSNEAKVPRGGETITSELIFYWMTAFNIPFEAKHWHLTRLFTLIKVASLKSQKPKKMSRQDAMAQQRAENARRLAATGSRG